MRIHSVHSVCVSLIACIHSYQIMEPLIHQHLLSVLAINVTDIVNCFKYQYYLSQYHKKKQGMKEPVLSFC